MKAKRLSVQGLAGLFAMLLIGLAAIAPLAGAVNASLDGRAELKQRKAAAALLAFRMNEERRKMMQSPRLYTQSRTVPDAAVLNEALTLSCERIVQYLSDKVVNATCSYSSSELGDALTRQDAMLTASGGVSALLEALDTIDPETRITQIALTSGLKQNAATMELRLHGVSKQAETSE